MLSLVKFALDQRTELPKATAPKPTRPLKPAASTGNTTLLVGGLVLACTAAALAYLRPAVVQKALARLRATVPAKLPAPPPPKASKK